MPLDPSEFEATAAALRSLYEEAELVLVQLITKQLEKDAANSRVTDVEWARRKLDAVRALRLAARAAIASLGSASTGALQSAVQEAFRTGWETAFSDIPPGSVPPDVAAAIATAPTELPGFGAIEALAGAVNFDVGTRASNILRDTVDLYRRAIAQTTTNILTGALTRQQAAQRAWSKLAKAGILSFTDKAGRRWQLSSYVEMATRAAMLRAGTAAQVDRLDAAGINLVSVGDHVQECALCRPFEGKVLATNGGPTGDVKVKNTLTNQPMTITVVDTLEGARLKGFQHPNCRHVVSVYLPGVTQLPTDTEDPDGDKARQRQRALERDIRAAKVEQAAALSPAAKQRAAAQVRTAQARLRDHLDAHPELKRLRYREQIGAGSMPKDGIDKLPTPDPKPDKPTKASEEATIPPPPPPADPSKVSPRGEKSEDPQVTAPPKASPELFPRGKVTNASLAEVHADRILYGNDSPGFEELPPEDQALIRGHLIETLTGVPERKVATLRGVQMGGMHNEGAYAEYNPQTRRIHLSYGMLREPAAKRPAWKPGAWLSDTGDQTLLASTLNHEFGHHLDLIDGAHSKAQLSIALERLIPGFPDNPEFVVKKVGTYASTNREETIAELWAQYRGNGKQTVWSRLVGEYFTQDQFDPDYKG